MHRNILISLLCIIFNYPIADGQGTKQPGPGKNKLIAEIDQILRAQVDSNKIPGAVIEIKQEGKLIYEHMISITTNFLHPRK